MKVIIREGEITYLLLISGHRLVDGYCIVYLLFNYLFKLLNF